MLSFVWTAKSFDLGSFLDALHAFSLACGGDGDPLPVVHDGSVYHDGTELASELCVEIPDDSRLRLEAGYTLFGLFTQFNDTGYACADGSEVEVPSEDEDEEHDNDDDEPRPHRPTMDAALVAATECDDCRGYGFLISLTGDEIRVELALICDLDGECECEVLEGPNLLTGPMTDFVERFKRPLAKQPVARNTSSQAEAGGKQ